MVETLIIAFSVSAVLILPSLFAHVYFKGFEGTDD